MVSIIFLLFSPYLGKISKLTSISFKWVGSTTNQKQFLKFSPPFPWANPSNFDLLIFSILGLVKPSTSCNDQEAEIRGCSCVTYPCGSSIVRSSIQLCTGGEVEPMWGDQNCRTAWGLAFAPFCSWTEMVGYTLFYMYVYYIYIYFRF